MVASTEKQLYLCSSCRRAGVKSKNSKVFDTFFCPRCKCETTLFLPKKSIVKELEPPKYLDVKTIENPNPTVENSTKITHLNRRSFFTIWDAALFMVGFIAGLLVIKL